MHDAIPWPKPEPHVSFVQGQGRPGDQLGRPTGRSVWPTHIAISLADPGQATDRRVAISLGDPGAISLAEPEPISFADPGRISYPGPSQAGGLLSVRQVAAILGVSTATVYKVCASGDLPSVRVGAALRVSREALVRWVAEREA